MSLSRLPVILFTLLSTFAMAQKQSGTIQGIVHDQEGQPLAFVNVVLKGTDLGISTNDEGRFLITNVPTGRYTVVFSRVGNKQVEKSVTVAEGRETTVAPVQLIEDHRELAEVIVSAGREGHYIVSSTSESLRINAPLMEVPQNISVVTKQSMRDFGIVGTSEMARMTSGIIKTYGGSNDFTFNIRGTEASNNIFRNGVGGYWWNQQSDAFMLERVEFVKGPAGFMIGNAEPGGLLNEVTKQADGISVAEAELGYGSWNLLRGGIDIGGKFSPGGKFSYRLVAGGQRTNAAYNFYKSYRTFVLPSLRYTYGQESYIQVEMNRMDGRITADNNSNVSLTGHDLLFPRNFNPIDPNIIDGVETDDTYLRLSHAHSLRNGWEIKTQIAKVEGIYSGDGMYVSAASPQYDTVYREYWNSDWRNKLQSAQAFINGKFTTGKQFEHAFLGGFDYGKTSVNSTYGNFNPEGYGTQLPLSVKAPVYNLSHENVAVVVMYPEDSWGTEWVSFYLQDHIKIVNRMVVTLAGRLSYTRSWASYDSATVYGTRATPRLGLTYLFNDHISVYALMDETFLPQTGRKADGKSASPLTGENIEVGYKSRLMKGRLAVNASLFHTVKNNVLVQNPQTTFYEERGQISSRGVEMDVTGHVNDNVVVNINYTLTDAKVTRDVNPDVVGFRNYGVAMHTANAMVRYKFLHGFAEGLSLGAGAQVVGDRSVVFAGYADVVDKDRVAPSYTIFDVNAGYDKKRFSIYVNVYNVLDDRYMETAWWNSGYVDEEHPENSTPGYYNFVPSQPINFRIIAAYKFW